MSLEVSCLHSDERVTRGVTLVKAVGREVFNTRPKLFDKITIRIRVLDSPLNKILFHLGNHFRNLLTNTLTQSISLTASKATQVFRNLHDLLLIHDNTIGFLESSFHFFMVINYALGVMLTANKVINPLHWARSIQGNHRNNIFKAVRLKLANVALHTGRF